MTTISNGSPDTTLVLTGTGWGQGNRQGSADTTNRTAGAATAREGKAATLKRTRSPIACLRSITLTPVSTGRFGNAACSGLLSNHAMKKALIVLALFLFLASAASSAELIEALVARVNDQPITRTEFESRCVLELRGSVDLDGRRRVLDEMIQEKLLEDRARELDVQANDAEVEEAVERVKRQYNLATDAEFDAALAQSKMTRDDLKKQLRQTITMQKVVGREVTGKINMSDDVLRLEYERKKDELYRTPEQAHIFEIVIHFSPQDAEARQAAVAKIEEARAKVASGTPFADAARQYSEGNARGRGGDLGTVAKGELLPALDATVFSDPPQDYPAPVLLPASVHLFHVVDRTPAGYRPFAEVRGDLQKRLGENIYEKRLAEYVEKLRHAAFVKIYEPALARVEEKKAS
jgi:peptidyl-prolyl cis-trans isomerase SurA